MNWRQLRSDCKLASVQQDYKKHCWNCGHSISFYNFEKDRKLCDYCGRYNFKNGLVEFKYKLNSERNKLKNVK